MTKKTPDSPLDIVTALMQERVKFEGWLTTLEDRRAETPLKVYERVRADYESRLSGVMEELKTHAKELEAQAEKYTSRLAELAEQEQERRDARAEGELRAHVGEVSQEEWDRTAKEADEALAAIAAEQAVVGADLNRVHELLGAATAATPSPAAAQPTVEAPEHAEEAPEPEPEPTILLRDTPAPAPSRETPEKAKFDEMAFLKSVVSPLDAKTPVESAQSSTAKPDDGIGLIHDQSDTLAESLVSRSKRSSQEREFIREDGEDAAASLVGKAPDQESPGDRPYAANVTGNNPIVLRPSGSVEQPKTLKCVECGAMNYPTEWYCERCGAELASL